MFPALAKYRQDLRRLQRNARLYLLSSVLTGLSTYLVILFFNLYAEKNGYSSNDLGVFNSLPNAAALALGLPVALWVDRVSRRRAFLVGGLLAVIALIIFVMTPNYIAWLVASVAMGASSATLIIIQAPFLLESSTEQERATLFSLAAGLYTLASAVASLVGGQLPSLIAAYAGTGPESVPAYRVTLALAAVLAGLALFPIAFLREQQVSTQEASTLLTIRSILRWNPLLIRLSLPNLLTGLGAALLVPFWNTFFKKTFGIPDGLLGLLFGFGLLATGAASLLAPVLADRVGKIRATVLTQASSIFFLLLIGFSRDFESAALAYLLRGALMNMGGPLYSAFAMEHVLDRDRALANGLLSFSWGIGWVISPYISGQVQAAVGFQPLFVATAIFYILAVGVTYYFFKDAEPDERASVSIDGATFMP